MKLYRDSFAPNLLELAGSPAELNATATRSADGKQLFFKAVNPTENSIQVSLSLQGDFKASTVALKLVAPDSLKSRNTLEQRNAVQVVTANVERAGNAIRFILPRWSVGVLRLDR